MSSLLRAAMKAWVLGRPVRVRKSKLEPHQGKREIARRLKQLQKKAEGRS
jgi:hypothetical protein